MAEVVHDVQQEFWRPPVNLQGASGILITPAVHPMA